MKQSLDRQTALCHLRQNSKGQPTAERSIPHFQNPLQKSTAGSYQMGRHEGVGDRDRKGRLPKTGNSLCKGVAVRRKRGLSGNLHN